MNQQNEVNFWDQFDIGDRIEFVHYAWGKEKGRVDSVAKNGVGVTADCEHPETGDVHYPAAKDVVLVAKEEPFTLTELANYVEAKVHGQRREPSRFFASEIVMETTNGVKITVRHDEIIISRPKEVTLTVTTRGE